MSARIPRLVIRIKHPLHKWRAVLLLGLACLAGAGLYFWGYGQAGFDDASYKRSVTELQSSNERLQSQKEELESRVAFVERTRQVEEAASQQLKTQVMNLQQEIQGLREEVAFYRGIVTPSGSRGGIRIQHFEIQPLAQERVFHYRLVLTQSSTSDLHVSGSVEVILNGLVAGAVKRLPLRDVAANQAKSLDYRFKYFQSLEGDILLPEDFSPHGVEVAVRPANGSDAVKKNFEWPAPRS